MDYSKLTILLEQLKIRVRDVKEALRALERLEASRGESDGPGSDATVASASDIGDRNRGISGIKAAAAGIGVNGKALE